MLISRREKQKPLLQLELLRGRVGKGQGMESKIAMRGLGNQLDSNVDERRAAEQ